MSHYGRISEADDLDRYYTPRWPVELLFEELDPEIWGPTVAEPCAGQGHIVEVLEEHGYDVVAGDIDPESPYPQIDPTDRPDTLPYRQCDSIITNPPYSADTASAFEVLKTMLYYEVPVAMLLRESFIEPCADRAACYRDDAHRLRPSRLLVLPRVDYGGPGGGDANPATSIWFIWRPDQAPVAPGETRMKWWTSEDRERVEGQEALI